MPAEHDDIAAVERACEELAASGQPISFKEVAVRAGTSRTTLYRRADLRALVEEHRTRGRGANTLTGLTVQIDQLRRSLEAVATKVRRQEERIRLTLDWPDKLAKIRGGAIFASSANAESSVWTAGVLVPGRCAEKRHHYGPGGTSIAGAIRATSGLLTRSNRTLVVPRTGPITFGDHRSAPLML
jgi:hypothetical protein